MGRVPSTAEPAGSTRSAARRWPDFRIIVAFLALAATLWLFTWLAGEVLEGEASGFDTAILLLFRNPADPSDPLGPLWFEEMVRDLTALGSVAVLTLTTGAVVMFLALARRLDAALVVVGCIGGGWLITAALKYGFERPRPALVPHGSATFSSSFPSSHAAMSAVVYLVLGALLARVQPEPRLKAYFMAWAVMLTLMIGLSRVYLAVHWPSDVLAGWTAGAAWALACWLGMRWLQRRRRVAGSLPGSGEPGSPS
jgi:undecaprenyl-diphosphatase